MPGAITSKYTGDIIIYKSGDRNVYWPTHSLRKRSGTVEEPVQVSVCLSRVYSTSDRRTNRRWSPPCGTSYRRDPGLHGPLKHTCQSSTDLRCWRLSMAGLGGAGRRKDRKKRHVRLEHVSLRRSSDDRHGAEDRPIRYRRLRRPRQRSRNHIRHGL